MHNTQGRIQEFQNGGWVGIAIRRGRILISKVYFEAPSHIPYVFVRKEVNNIHIVNTSWILDPPLTLHLLSIILHATYQYIYVLCMQEINRIRTMTNWGDL